MGNLRKIMGFLVILTLTAAFLNGCATAPVNPWSDLKMPTQGEPTIIGTYTAGCLGGATSLHADGPGYQLMRLSRGKFFGHPALTRFIEQLGRQVNRRKLGQVLIGNLGQARGGPTLVGHRSHQIGLDVDIWYWQPSHQKRLTLGEREFFHSPSVVLESGLAVNPGTWTEQMASILRVAAAFEEVERIFVHPAIKKELCATKVANKAWLSKIRPWWGHDDHFHVRLKCPADQPGCRSQEPVVEGEGCDQTLEWWFSDEARNQARDMDRAPAPSKLPKLPEACNEMILRSS